VPWNTPYVIDANNTDHHPLVAQVAVPEFPLKETLSLIVILSSIAVVFGKKRIIKKTHI
jgi:hypothetical protein